MKLDAEYIIVTDKTSIVLKSFSTYSQAKSFASVLRQAGGEVTIFKSLENTKEKKGN